MVSRMGPGMCGGLSAAYEDEEGEAKFGLQNVESSGLLR